ncbi:hypothetical protein CerSpe_173340 [Prunus speciosa]
MIYLLWNCQGLGSDLTVRALRGLIHKHRPPVVFLMETKMLSKRIDGVRRRMGFYNGFNVDPVGVAGGLSLWWDNSVEIEVLLSTPNLIDSTIKILESGMVIRGSWVYGTPYREHKVEFWCWMEASFSPTDIPWLCGGDLNEFLWSLEKRGGSEVTPSRPRYMYNFMLKIGLLDLGFNGPTFTWRGRTRTGNLVQERINRCLANTAWQVTWPNTRVLHETVLGSDHCPMVLVSKPSGNKHIKLFKFEAHWIKEDESYQIVNMCWQSQVGGSWIKRWHKKN